MLITLGKQFGNAIIPCNASLNSSLRHFIYIIKLNASSNPLCFDVVKNYWENIGQTSASPSHSGNISVRYCWFTNFICRFINNANHCSQGHCFFSIRQIDLWVAISTDLPLWYACWCVYIGYFLRDVYLKSFYLLAFPFTLQKMKPYGSKADSSLKVVWFP